jgi:hypothetical protein
MSCEDWPIRWNCDITDVDDELLDLARTSAQSVLWAITGHRYGVCESRQTFRMPCDSPCVRPYARDFGPGVEYALGGRKRQCCALHLTSKPVASIESVSVNGELLDASEYELERDVLRRLGACWPCDDECDVAPISVTYKYGIPVPALGELALGELACEMLNGLRGLDCRLPSNAISVTRQGITVDLGDAETLYEQMRVGLPLVDAFIRMANPGRLIMASTVHTPDIARRAR